MNNYVRAKKHLGQHFLKDELIAANIVAALPDFCTNVIEVGPGMGVLTKYLINKSDISLKVVEVDWDSVAYLKENYPSLTPHIIEKDFLKIDLKSVFNGTLSIIGNYPYNISSQILFKVLENRDIVTCCLGMFQKEVAQRIAAPKGNKTYGILSVLCQAFYNVEYLFTVDEHVFAPPPKVKSAVIRLMRKENYSIECNEEFFFKVVKTAFNQRRKTLRNALKIYLAKNKDINSDILDKRAEQLGVDDFIKLTLHLQE
ncbi:MAG: 16S rRNA (adenine(1518)-N(6)/adenine(1519)-N(6))-dimethyltransferase RsmA [Bacteroidia bacterium]|nr:16S rRNA (adenine(1518)-N(6)/adenine(1519)-N(6))-dimethyltransferase RsmA [Bacteroidia bacterium]MCZ2247675.1 16S rRNA (adenine(1518)-N(6)/adenine(1519)-N(6))-dimethyltransferase RsmA [Bacteroidia bacterium]